MFVYWGKSYGVMITFSKELDSEKIKSHILNLYHLAKIDNKLVDVEMDYLFQLGKRHGISTEEVKELVSNNEEVTVELPDDKQHKLLVLYELIGMMLVDDRLDEREANMCTLLAEKMGFDFSLVRALVNGIITAIEETNQREITWEELQKYLDHPEWI